MQEECFFELIQLSIGCRQQLSRMPSVEEWDAVYQMAQKQALVGICFVGITKLRDAGLKLPQQLYYEWLAMTAQIQERNQQLNAYIPKVTELFRSYGFPCYVLKGQSIGKLYGELAEFRQSGDIDVWTVGGRRKICSLSMSLFGKIEGLTYHHIHFPYLNDVEIEAHFKPGYLNSPRHNRCLEKIFALYEPSLASVSDDAPTSFNLIYILLHCYMHFLERGVGLRQLMDYYFVILSISHNVRDEKETVNNLKNTGLLKFARAVMWVLMAVFGMEEQYAICKPDKHEGQFLLKEILQTGNFGHQDPRYNWRLSSPIRRFWANQVWNFHLLIHYPEEILWSPFAAIYRYAAIKQWSKRPFASDKWDELQQLNTEL